MTPTPVAAASPADVAAERALRARAGRGDWPRWEPPFAALTWLGVVLSLTAGALASLRGEWTPILDIAALDIRTQAIPDYWPLVGVFSRLGWYHPGPLFILQGWLPYEVWGPAGLTIAMLAVHVLALTVAWLVARRLDRLAGGFVLLAVVVVLAARSPSQVLEPWNPYAGLVGTATLLVLAWAAAQRRPIGSLLLLPVASYLLQAHLGYAPLVALVTLAALVLAVLPGPDRDRTVGWWVWLAGAAVASVMWLPVMWQQVSAETGNISAIVDGFGQGDQALGPATGWAVMSNAFTTVPYWIADRGILLPDSAATPWWLLLVAAASVISIRRRDQMALRALVVCLAATMAGFVAVSAASGVAVEYLVSWIPAVAAVTIALSLWALTRSVRALHAPRRAAALSAAVSGAALLLAVATGWSWAQTSQEYPGHGQAAAALGQSLVSEAGSTDVYLALDGGNSFASALDTRMVYYGVLAAAVRGGVDVSVPESISWEVAGVLPAGQGARPAFVVRQVDPARGDDGSRVVAIWNPLTPDELRHLSELDAALGSGTLTEAQARQQQERRQSLLGDRVAFELVQLPGATVATP